MKHFLLLALALVGITRSTAQEGWKIGVEVTPTLFWLYNTDDWNSEAFMKGQDPLIFSPNGIQTGISVKRTINEHFEASAGLLYTYGKQNYYQIDSPTGTYTSGNYVRKDECYAVLQHLKLPLAVSAFLWEEGSTPYLQIGIAPTCLVGLSAFRGQTSTDVNNYAVHHRLLSTMTDVTLWDKENGQDEVVYNAKIKQFAYNIFALDALLGIGYKISVSDNIDIRTQLTGTISIIDPETKNPYGGGIEHLGSPPPTRPKTSMINAGLSISANYIF